jgi:hypothetical protein
MALLDDGRLAKTIAQALGGVMGTLTLSRTSEGEYDPSTGGVTEGATTTYAVKGMIEDFDSMTLQKASAFMDGSLIRQGDRRATILAHGLAITPVPRDKQDEICATIWMRKRRRCRHAGKAVGRP